MQVLVHSPVCLAILCQIILVDSRRPVTLAPGWVGHPMNDVGMLDHDFPVDTSYSRDVLLESKCTSGKESDIVAV